MSNRDEDLVIRRPCEIMHAEGDHEPVSIEDWSAEVRRVREAYRIAEEERVRKVRSGELVIHW